MTDVIEAGRPNLRVFRVLDESRLTDAFVDANERFEGGTLPYIDVDRPRDAELTEEILETTIGAVLVDQNGEIVANFEGKLAWQQAEAARQSARITFTLDVPEPKQKRSARQKVEDAVTVADPASEDDEDFGAS